MQLLVLPGMDGTPSLRSAFVDALPPEANAKVVAYPTDQALDYVQLESLVRPELPNSPFILVGESFSGPLAISLAASNPAGLRGLVLAGSFARNPIALPRSLALFATLFPISLLPSRFIVTRLLGSHPPKLLRDRLLSVISTVRSPVWRNRLRAIIDVDVVGQLSKIRVPILYLRPTADRIVPRSACDAIVRANPTTRVVELEGPHFILAARPAESAAHITRFMREAASAH